MSLKVVEKYLPVGHPNRPGIKLLGLKARVWHGTANQNHGADDTANVNYASRPYVARKNPTTGKVEFFEAVGVKPFNFGVAHVYIDKDSATLAIPLDEVAYSCGDRQLPYQNHTPGIEGYKGQRKLAYDVFRNQNNSYTWSIELCMDEMGLWETVCNNAIEFVRVHMPGLALADYRHYDLTAKNCPSPFVNLNIRETDPRWVAFRDKVRGALA